MLQFESSSRVLRMGDYVEPARLLEELAGFGLVPAPHVVLAQIEVGLRSGHLALVATPALEQLEHFIRRQLTRQHSERRTRPVATRLRGRTLEQGCRQRLAKPLVGP